jgi:hypothetical protein
MYLSAFNWPKDRQLLDAWTNKQSYISNIIDCRNQTKNFRSRRRPEIQCPSNGARFTASVIRFELKGKVEITAISMAKKKMSKGALDDEEKIKLQHKIVQI